MKKFILSCILISFIFMANGIIFFHINSNITLHDERRKQTQFPSFPENMKTKKIKDYFHSIDNFINDRIPGRSLFVDYTTIVIAGILNDNLDIDKCYRGKDNWLYLGNKYNNISDKMIGKISLQGDNLNAQINKFYNRHKSFDMLGIQYILFIAPNKGTIYPEYLPDFIKPAPVRYIAPLLEGLIESNVCVYDPVSALLDSKKHGSLYLRSDTHWNLLGAEIAFSKFLEKMHWPPLPPHDLLSVQPWPGDLLAIGKLKEIYVHPKDGCYKLSWHSPMGIDVLSTNGKKTTVQNDKYGPYPPGGVVYNAHASTGKTAWIFCDSFSQALYPYINATFKETRYFFGRKPDWQEMLAKTESKPDIVMDIFTERSY